MDSSISNALLEGLHCRQLARQMHLMRLPLDPLAAQIAPELHALKGVEDQEGVRHKDNFDHTIKVLGNISKKSDNIFIWGNNAQVYKLTEKLPPGRYTVA